MNLPSPEEADRMSGTEVVNVLRQVVRDEIEACARVADAAAERFPDCVEVAQVIAAQIRARRPT